MKRVLLYSPDVVGHPRVYCRVIADALKDADCEITVALGCKEQAGLAESPDLHPLADRAGVVLLDNRTVSKSGNPHLTIAELVSLQERLKIDTTLFIEADKSVPGLRQIAAGDAPRLKGRNLGIFAATSEWHPGEDTFTGAPLTLRAPTLRTTLGNIKRAIFNRSDALPYFYEKLVIGQGILDEIIVKDERLANWRGPPVRWMPEISRPEPAPETPEQVAEYEHWARELKSFREHNPGREPVLYFGDAAYYKGYDLFLEFVCRTPSTCAIHAGRGYGTEDRAHFRSDVDAMRADLKAQGRLLETNDYVHTQRLKELFFGSVRVYLTTHRLALSSSTMLQALELGIPVLVPDRGLLGWRVREHGLGDVYRYEDLEDLAAKADALWRSDVTRFKRPAAAFWEQFSDASVRSFFRQALLA